MKLVKLVAPHTVAGKKHQAGEVIELEDDVADWLMLTVSGQRGAAVEALKQDPHRREWWESRQAARRAREEDGNA